MELEFDREVTHGYEVAAGGTVCQEETLETIVPDACPDILRIVAVRAQATLNSKQAREGLAEASGSVRAVVLYQPEEGSGLRRLETALPFTSQMDAPGLTPQGQVSARARVRGAEARALNPRKVLLRVDLAVDLTAFQPAEYVGCQAVLEPEEHKVEQMIAQTETYSLSAVGEKPFTFTDQIRLGGTGEGAEVLTCQAQPVCGECKLIGSKLIFKGSVELQLLVQEAGGAMTPFRESMPFSQVMEIPGVGEGADCRMELELTQVTCLPSGEDGRSVELTLDLLAQAQVWCHRPVQMLQDLYSTAWETQVEREEQTLWKLVDQSDRAQNVRELLETGSIPRSVVDSWVELGEVAQSREGDEAVLTGQALVTVLYLDEEEAPQTFQRSLPVACRLEAPAGAVCRCQLTCPGEVFATPAAGGLEVRFTAQFQYQLLQPRRALAVSSAVLGEPRGQREGQQPSVVLRLAAPGETLWDIAKAYATTQSQILQANQLEEGALPTGKMLLIPAAF